MTLASLSTGLVAPFAGPRGGRWLANLGYKYGANVNRPNVPDCLYLFDFRQVHGPRRPGAIKVPKRFQGERAFCAVVVNRCRRPLSCEPRSFCLFAWRLSSWTCHESPPPRRAGRARVENTSNILRIKEVPLAYPTLFVGMSNDHWATGTPIPQWQVLCLRAWSRLVSGTLSAGGK